MTFHLYHINSHCLTCHRSHRENQQVES